MQVKLKKEDFQAMAAHAVAHLPEEACGLIAGEKSDTERVIKKVYYLTNIDHTNEHFSLDPKEQLAAIKDMRKNGLEPLMDVSVKAGFVNVKYFSTVFKKHFGVSPSKYL